MKRTGFKIKPRKPLKRTAFKKRVKSKTTKKYIANETRKWHDKAWTKWSELVRRRAKGICYTCGATKDWKEMHASHFIHDRLDFDERNIHACCVKCNTYLSGNLGNYALHLIEDIGLEGINKLKQDAMQSLATGLNKVTVEDYQKMCEEFDIQILLL